MILSWLSQLSSLRLSAWTGGELLLLSVGLLLSCRHVALLVAAERGRQRDLVKKHQQTPVRKAVTVLVPCLELTDLTGLQTLLTSLMAQDYPAGLLHVQIVCTMAVSDGLVPILQVARQGMIKSYVYPLNEAPSEGASMTWLIDRCLAASGESVYVFLKPCDAVKPDFISTAVARSSEAPVLQGLMLDRYAPRTLLGCLQSLSNRIQNRVINAGRYHLGWSGWLLDSGWVARQEVLEMVVYHRADHLQNDEYTLGLALQNIRVSWAPSLQVFREQPGQSLAYLSKQWLSLGDQLRLILQYGPVLTLKSLLRFDFQYVDLWVNLLTPPAMVMAVGLMVLGLAAYWGYFPGSLKVYVTLLAMLLSLQTLSLLVARCRAQELMTAVFLSVPGYLWCLLFAPLAFVQAVGILTRRPGAQNRQAKYRQNQRTRFHDELYVPLRPLLEDSRFYDDETDTAINEAFNPPVSSGKAYQPFILDEPQECVLSKNGKQLPCFVTTHESNGRYRLTLEYRGASFSTQGYSDVEDAYDELRAKLTQFGLQLLRGITANV